MPLATWTDAQIFAQLYSGYQWNGLTITYAFPTSTTGTTGGNGEWVGFQALGSSTQTQVRLALQTWSDLIRPAFVEVGPGQPSNIEVASTSSGIDYAHAYLPSSGSIWLNSTATSLRAAALGSHGFHTYVHEIGHALGLKHMGDYNGGGSWTPSCYQDSHVYSVMSYFGVQDVTWSSQIASADWISQSGVRVSAQTPMLNDVMAIQSMYGRSTTTRVENTTYGFNATVSGAMRALYDFTVNATPVLTLFDSGGNDTLDLSGWHNPSTLSLVSGTFSSANAMTNNIAIAHGCVIENAIGGSGNDSITGNEAANLLRGMFGNDSLFGGGGDDVLEGGAGQDMLDGGSGLDTAIFSGSYASHTISYNAVTSTYWVTDGRLERDTLTNIEIFSFTDQTFWAGPKLIPIINGSSGDDILTGTAAADLLRGLTGNDSLDGGAGVDTAIYSGDRASYVITRTAQGFTVSGPDGTDTLLSVERLRFSDVSVALDSTGSGGQAYRMYQAAFNRAPDLGGLGYQMKALDEGLDLASLARNFIASPEFSATYGTPDSTRFVTQLYANVLRRAPDADGLAYHVNSLASGLTRADVLVGFSESPENQAALIGVIQNGMAYAG